MEHELQPVSRAGAPAPAEPLELHRRLIESLTDYAIFALSDHGLIASWNSGAKAIFGYSEDEVLGLHFSLIFTPEDIAEGRPDEELRIALKFGKECVEGWHVRKDGSRFWCTDTVQPVLDAAGALTGFTKLVRDTSEHHVSEERLRESEERLRLLVESVTDYAIFSVDVDGTILLWNSGAENIFGYRGADVIGKHFSLIYSAEAIAKGVPAAELEAALRDGHAQDEGWHVRRNGERFYASGQMTRLKPDADGNARGFVKVAHDITARNAAQEMVEWKAFHDELTDLPNRAFFCDCLRRSIAHAKRHSERLFAVIYIDLDHFKIINDSLGHVTADGLLVTVARLLERSVRPEDVVATQYTSPNAFTRRSRNRSCSTVLKRIRRPAWESLLARAPTTKPKTSYAMPIRRCTKRKLWAARAT